jgi:hypothetical protein
MRGNKPFCVTVVYRCQLSGNIDKQYWIENSPANLDKPRADIRVVSVGVGEYPPKPLKRFSKMWWAKKYYPESVELMQKVMEINTQSMDQLHAIMFKDVPTIRVNDSFPEPHMATDLAAFASRLCCCKWCILHRPP